MKTIDSQAFLISHKPDAARRHPKRVHSYCCPLTKLHQLLNFELVGFILHALQKNAILLVEADVPGKAYW